MGSNLSLPRKKKTEIDNDTNENCLCSTVLLIDKYLKRGDKKVSNYNLEMNIFRRYNEIKELQFKMR